MPPKPKPVPTPIDNYLAALDAKQRAALSKIRAAIRAAAPKAEECISYQLAAFRLDGMLVAFGASANHCAFYVMSSTTLDGFKDELKGYDLSKGTIRFQPHKPLPALLVKKLVKARLAENAARRTTPAGRPAGVSVVAGTGRKTAAPKKGPQPDPAVAAFLRDLKHPLKAEIEAARAIILAAAPGIGEGIKWNAPSFRTTEYFATVNLRAKDHVQLIFHRGAKVKDNSTKAVKFSVASTPACEIKWLATDRFMLTLRDDRGLAPGRGAGKALRTIVREWIPTV